MWDTAAICGFVTLSTVTSASQYIGRASDTIVRRSHRILFPTNFSHCHEVNARCRRWCGTNMRSSCPMQSHYPQVITNIPARGIVLHRLLWHPRRCAHVICISASALVAWRAPTKWPFYGMVLPVWSFSPLAIFGHDLNPWETLPLPVFGTIVCHSHRPRQAMRERHAHTRGQKHAPFR